MIENAPELAALFFASAFYALALQTEPGRKLATRRTWLTVVLGVAMVLSTLAVIPGPDDLLTQCVAYAIAGTPMIVRSLYNEMKDEDRANEVE